MPKKAGTIDSNRENSKSNGAREMNDWECDEGIGIVMVVERGESAERDDGGVKRAVGRLRGCMSVKKRHQHDYLRCLNEAVTLAVKHRMCMFSSDRRADAKNLHCRCTSYAKLIGARRSITKSSQQHALGGVFRERALDDRHSASLTGR